jgi:hypothetical protein
MKNISTPHQTFSMAPKGSKGELTKAADTRAADTSTADEIDDTLDKISTIDNEISATKVEIAVVETKLKIDELEASMVGLRETPDGTIRVRGVEGANSRSPVVLAINHKPIFCTEEGYVADQWSVTPLTVVRVEDAGYSKAPFARGMSKQKLADALPLAAIEGDSLRMWSFKKGDSHAIACHSLL